MKWLYCSNCQENTECIYLHENFETILYRCTECGEHFAVSKDGDR